MKKWIHICLVLIMLLFPLGSMVAHAESLTSDVTEDVKKLKPMGFEIDWTIATYNLGFSPVYFSAYGRSVHYRSDLDYGTPVRLKNGDTYFLVWDNKDFRNNSILCLSDKGEVKWEFKPKVPFSDFYHPVVDGQGNIYYGYSPRGEEQPIGIHYIQSVNNQGKIRWTTQFKTKDYKFHEFFLLSNEKELLFSSPSKNFRLSASTGKAVELPKNQQQSKLIVGENNGNLIFLVDNQIERKTTYEVYDSNNKLKYKINEEYNLNPWRGRGTIHLMKDGSLLMSCESYDPESTRFVYYDQNGKRLWETTYPRNITAGEYFTDGKIIWMGIDVNFVDDREYKMWSVDVATGRTIATLDNASPYYIGSYEAKYRLSSRLDTIGPSDQLKPDDMSLYADVNYRISKLNPYTLEQEELFFYPPNVQYDSEYYNFSEKNNFDVVFRKYMFENGPFKDKDLPRGNYYLLSYSNGIVYFYYHSPDLGARTLIKAHTVEKEYIPTKHDEEGYVIYDDEL